MAETNILSASVKLALDGKEYTLSYRAHAFIVYAEVCKSDLLQDIRGFGEHLKALGGAGEGLNAAELFGRLRDLLWAGMLHAHPEILREQVGHLFGFQDLGAILAAITQAIQLTNPAPAARPILPPGPPEGSRRINGPWSGLGSATDADLPPASSEG